MPKRKRDEELDAGAQKIEKQPPKRAGTGKEPASKPKIEDKTNKEKKPEAKSEVAIAPAADVMDAETFTYVVSTPPVCADNAAIVELLERTAIYKHYAAEDFNSLGLLRGATVYKNLPGPLGQVPVPVPPRVWSDFAAEYLRTGGTIRYCEKAKEQVEGDPEALSEIGSSEARQALFDSVVKLKVDHNPPDKKTLDMVDKALREMSQYTVKELQAMLRINEQIITGTRTEVLERVAHGSALGALPKCPKCFGGKLAWDRNTGLYCCRGFMDDDEYQPCFFRTDSIERLEWKK